MSRPVSIVIPALDDFELFDRNLPRLFSELARRDLDDEVLIVDDTGRDALRARLSEAFPRARVLVREENGGFAASLRSGMEQARHELCFSMNPDVFVRAGFLEPLISCLDDPETVAAVPRVLLNGDEDRIESLVALEFFGGLVEIRQPGLEEGENPGALVTLPVAFAVGGACLLRKREFLEGGGYDSLFEPFYWEDVDWCWNHWRAGRRSVYVPASVVEHHHRGTIGRLVPPELVRAALEKNRLIFHWKHIDDPELLKEHVEALYRLVLEAWLEERRLDLVWLNLALDQAEDTLKTRRSLTSSKFAFDEVHARARPVPLDKPLKDGPTRSGPTRKKVRKKKAPKRRKK